MTFEQAQELAERNGLQPFWKWCDQMERRYTTMPSWYWNAAERRAAYAADIERKIQWQNQQAIVAKQQADNFPVRVNAPDAPTPDEL